MDVFTREFELKVSEEGCRYTFYCDICGSGYSTPLFHKSSVGDEAHFLKAQEEARLLFNYCPDCARWVCDNDYNIDAGRCVECAPVR